MPDLQKFYIRTARQLLRIEAVRKSPINSHMDESLAGATCIRAFNAQERFTLKMDQLVNDDQSAFFLSFVVARLVSGIESTLLLLNMLENMHIGGKDFLIEIRDMKVNFCFVRFRASSLSFIH